MAATELQSNDGEPVQRLARLLAGQKRVLEMVALGEPLDSILNALITLVESQDSSMVCTIMVAETSGTHLRCAAPSRLHPEYVQLIQRVPIGPQYGCCGAAAECGQRVISDDIAVDSRWITVRDVALKHGLRACWSEPILARDGLVLGTFAIYYDRPATPTPRQIELIDMAGRIAAMALQRHRQDEALRRSEQRYRRLVEATQEGVWMIDAEGITTFANRGIAELLGYTAGELIGKSVFELMDPATAAQSQERLQRRRGGVTEGYDLRLRHREGREVWVHMSATPLFSPDGAFEGAMSIVTDITQRKRFEEQLEIARDEAEASSAAKDRFLANLSHELRTPLTPVLSMVQMLEMRTNLPDDVQSDLAIIRRNIDLQARLIDDLLNLTRITRGKIELQCAWVSLHDVLHSALRICQPDLSAKGHQLKLDLSAARDNVWGDLARLHEVFWNLLSNAIKFTPREGTIELRTSDSGERIRVEVVDTGCGFDPQTTQALFEPFEQGAQVTRQYGGLGLGLAISKALVELHGGTISARSDGAQRGAAFTVELPISTGSGSVPEHAPGMPLASMRHLSRPRVLLVEDHADTREVLDRLLTAMNCEVMTAGTLAEAIEIGSGAKFDLLISDLGLPDGSGLDLIRRLAQTGSIRGIALSGFGMEEDVRRAHEAGFERHLTKPIDVAVLEQTISQMLGHDR